MDSKVESSNSEVEELTIEELEEVLGRFEPDAELYKFRNTAIYHCFKLNLGTNVRESTKRPSTGVSRAKIDRRR
jgi:hypothetical protein